MTPLQRVLDRLPDHKRNGSGWTARCPGHDDRQASLSIGEGATGAALVHCHAGCRTEDVVKRLGLTMKDLAADAVVGAKATTPRPAAKPPRLFASADEAVKVLEQQLGPKAAYWTYNDANGGPCGVVVRWNCDDGSKDIRPVARRDGGWSVGAMRTPRPLYHLPEIREAGPETLVYVCEGEKCSDAVMSLGLTATTSAGGSAAAKQTDWSPLGGRTCIVMPDNDNPGRKYAADVTAILHGLNPPAVVKVVELPGLANGEDIADWLPRQGDKAAALAELNRLVSVAPVEERPIDPEVDNAPTAEPAMEWQPFPTDALPDDVRDFVRAVAGATSTDPSFAALACLVVLAGCIGNRIGVCKKRGWIEPAVLWGTIVAPSSAVKSPVFREVTRPIVEHYKEQRADFIKRRAEYDLAKERYQIELAEWKKSQREGPPTDPPVAPEPPRERRLMVSDITTEKLGKLLQENPAGLLAVRDELAGLIGSFDRYAAGGKGSDAANWQQMFNASHLTIDRKCEAGSIFVERAAVSILGTIQLGTLRRVFAAPERESGLLARFLVVNPPYEAQVYSDAEIGEDVAATWTAIIRGILAIETPEDDHGDMQTRYLGLSHEASDLYIQWHDGLARELTGLDNEDLRAHWGKLKGIALRIALVFAVVDGLKDHHVERVNADAMQRAIAIINWFKHESARLYSEIIIVGRTEGDRDRRRRLVELIRRSDKTPIPGVQGDFVSVREWQRLRSHKTAADAETELNELVGAGLGSWKIPPQQGPGRPTKLFILRSDGTPTLNPSDTLTFDKTPCGDSGNGNFVSVNCVGTPDGPLTDEDRPPVSDDDAESALAADENWEVAP